MPSPSSISSALNQQIQQEVAAGVAANAAASRANSTVQVSPPGTQNQIRRLQQYVSTNRVPTILTQPGYELCIYSRFSKDAKADLYANTLNFTGYTKSSDVPNAGAGNNSTANTIVTPDFRFFSNTFNSNGPVLIGRDQNPVITSISAHQIVDNASGSVGVVELIQPDGIEFFKPTLGHAPPDYPDIDYHTSTNPNDGPLRVGVMDTVLVRMSNTFYDNFGQPQRITETVFRGVIGEIRRTKSATDGSTITMQLFDFSEFLRQITGIGMGIFSTSNFHLTGRGYITKLVEYSNGLYSGNKRILNVTEDIADQVGNQIEQSILTSFVDIVPAAGPLTTNAASGRANPNHAMSCPPLFWLQYAPHDKISIDNSTPPINAATNSVVAAAQAIANDVVQGAQALINQVTSTITTDLNAIKAGQASSLLTPEDQESIKTYKIFGGTVPQNIQQSVSSLFQQFNIPVPNGAELSEIAWALSDLYIEKGLINFAQEILWQSIYGVAERTLREAYFDFAPKLRPGDNSDPKAALIPFDTASVADIVAAGNQGLPDIHPNVGILKYRLSPCFIPYPPPLKSNQTALGPDVRNPGSGYSSQFRFYSFSDNDTLLSDFSETEQNVFTAVFGFGNDVGKTSFTDTLKSLLDGQSQGLIATAETLDTRIESRLGYRFKTNHDESIRIPILMYLTSYSLLHKSQANMFQQSLTIPGDPRVQPGSIVQVQALNADFYCTQVLHKWDLQAGYTSQLQLQYGHTTGQFPSMLQAYGTTETGYNNTQNNCTLSTMTMQTEGISNLQPIGGINQGCLIYALQQLMQPIAITSTNPTLGGAPAAIPTSGKLNFAQLESLWVSAGGSQSDAPIMAWIALGESGGDPTLPSSGSCSENSGVACVMGLDTNGKGGYQYAGGLWQISDGTTTPMQNVLIPFTNAQYAVRRLHDQGFGAWGLPSNLDTAYTLQEAYNKINSRYDGNVASLVGTPNFSSANIQTMQWPYNVYGTIGMQLTSWNKGPNGSSNNSTYQAQLLDKTQGLKDAIAYIKYLSSKYAANNAPFAPYAGVQGADFSVVNQSDKLAKVIAAWFCDDGDAPISKYKPGFLSQIIAQVESLYNTCTTCAASTPPPLNAASPAELAAASSNRKALATSKNIVWSGRDGGQVDINDILDSTKTSNDLIVFMSNIVLSKGWFVEVTALNTDHSSDGSGPGYHSSGNAVDWRPLITPSESNFYSPSDPMVQRFISDCAAGPGLYQVGLGGPYQLFANYVAGGSPSGVELHKIFTDNDQPHIHCGVS